MACCTGAVAGDSSLPGHWPVDDVTGSTWLHGLATTAVSRLQELGSDHVRAPVRHQRQTADESIQSSTATLSQRRSSWHYYCWTAAQRIQGFTHRLSGFVVCRHVSCWNSLPSHVTTAPPRSPSSVLVLNRISSHFLIPLSDSPLMCTVPAQWLVVLDTML